MTRIRYEVLPTPRRDRKADPGLLAWTVTRRGQRLATHDTQAAAVTFASTTARAAWRHCRQASELVIKGRRGKIIDTRSYGRDPATTKG